LDKKIEEVKEITPEVLIEEELWAIWVEKENEGVEMVTPEIMATWAEKEREIEEEEEIKVENFEPSIKKEIPIEPSIIQSPIEEKKEIRKKQSINNINNLKKPIKLFT